MLATATEYAAQVALMGVAVGVVLTYLRMMRGDNREFREEFRARFAALEERMLAVETDKVDVAQWAKSETTQTKLIMRVFGDLARLKGRVDATVAMGGILHRAEAPNGS